MNSVLTLQDVLILMLIHVDESSGVLLQMLLNSELLEKLSPWQKTLLLLSSRDKLSRPQIASGELEKKIIKGISQNDNFGHFRSCYHACLPRITCCRVSLTQLLDLQQRVELPKCKKSFC